MLDLRKRLTSPEKPEVDGLDLRDDSSSHLTLASLRLYLTGTACTLGHKCSVGRWSAETADKQVCLGE